MKTRTIKHIVTPSILVLLLSSLTGCNSEFNGYYRRLNTRLDGDEFKASLHDVIYHTVDTNYASMQRYHLTADKDPENSENILLFYTGQSVPTKMTAKGYIRYGDGENDIQREHVWPQSRFRVYGSMDGTYGKAENPGPATDIYNVRPCMGYVNENRSNYFYDTPVNPSEGDYEPFDPKYATGVEDYRGDMARIIFYVATRYEKLEIIEASTDSTGANSHTFGRLSTLLKWNLEYAVQEREKIRNDAVQELQGNRNPFVDHPEYACKIWGNTNAATKSVCGLK